MDPLVYRPANENDLDFIIQLAARVFLKYGTYDEIVPGWFSDPEVITIIVTEKTDPLGFAMLAMEKQRMFKPRRAHLLAIAVFPEYQRKGIGSGLLGHIEDLARKYDVRGIQLWTATDNTQAISFFQKAGFKIIGSENRYYPRGQPALALSKKLDP
ncbi:MAG: GNAT family N-acetyltransferase [Gammaproteobacteria bacterium]|nr:GNAT family N-acetyltransferase [Gammaproteobacteria bacterium]